MRKTAILRSKRLKRKKGMRKQSQKMKARMEKYYLIRNQFLRENPWCVFCTMLRGTKVPATEVHHSRSRNGPLLFDTRFFVSSCRADRLTTHHNPKWAREVGVLAEAKDWGVVPE